MITGEKAAADPERFSGDGSAAARFRFGFPRCSCCLFAACAWLRRASARRTCLCQAHAMVPNCNFSVFSPIFFQAKIIQFLSIIFVIIVAFSATPIRIIVRIALIGMIIQIIPICVVIWIVLIRIIIQLSLRMRIS